MRKSTRILILTGIIEALLLFGAAYMLYQVTTGGWPTFDRAEAITRITTVMGTALGGIGGIFLFLGFFLRRKGE